MKINNVPEYAYGKNYIVIIESDGEGWFYGAWDDEAKAQEVAEEIDGKVIDNKAML